MQIAPQWRWMVGKSDWSWWASERKYAAGRVMGVEPVDMACELVWNLVWDLHRCHREMWDSGNSGISHWRDWKIRCCSVGVGRRYCSHWRTGYIQTKNIFNKQDAESQPCHTMQTDWKATRIHLQHNLGSVCDDAFIYGRVTRWVNMASIYMHTGPSVPHVSTGNCSISHCLQDII